MNWVFFGQNYHLNLIKHPKFQQSHPLQFETPLFYILTKAHFDLSNITTNQTHYA